ncbi:MAG: hypothetical protein IPK26_22420 [Planctomycetes bacterium]|nr:hypothetical protein [Planctomycetota bacterium]
MARQMMSLASSADSKASDQHQFEQEPRRRLVARGDQPGDLGAETRSRELRALTSIKPNNSRIVGASIACHAAAVSSSCQRPAGTMALTSAVPARSSRSPGNAADDHRGIRRPGRRRA